MNESLTMNSLDNLGNSNNTNIESNKKSSYNKRKFLLEDSDEDDTVPIKKKLVSDDSDEENYVKQNVFKNKNNKILEDSDEEETSYTNKKFQIDENNAHNCDLENNLNLIKNKTTVEENDILNVSVESDGSFKGENIFPIKKKLTLLEDSDNENDNINMNDSKLQSNENGTKTNINNKEKLLLENSDTDEEIGTFVKKNKYFINDDSD